MEDNTPMLSNLLTFNRGETRWFDRAECRKHDPRIWFPEPPTSDAMDRARYADEVADAQEICGTCPVKDLCLKDASDRGEVHGVWGGKDFYKSRRQQALESRAREKVPA